MNLAFVCLLWHWQVMAFVGPKTLYLLPPECERLTADCELYYEPHLPLKPLYCVRPL